MEKIEKLPDGSVFLGSGHLFPIGQCRLWAVAGFTVDEEPDWSYFQEDPDDRGFQCVHISADGNTVTMVDGELSPIVVLDDFVAIGSGAAYAIGALEAGADVVRAVEIAAMRDPSTSAPITTHVFED